MAFTWTRGTGHVIVDSGPGVFDSIFMFQFAPGDDATVRRVIVDWGVEMIATDKAGSINYLSPVTLGLSDYSYGDDTLMPPGDGPSTDPNVPWAWWQNAWYTNQYGAPVAAGSSNGAFAANGRIDRKNNTLMLNDRYTQWWATCEVDDGSSLWTKWVFSIWWQILHSNSG